MKSMLYIGATLMIGASIYGFADYRQTHNKKEFREMYAEKKSTATVTPVARKSNEKLLTEKKEVVTDKSANIKKKADIKKSEIKSVQPIPDEDKITVKNNILATEPIALPEPPKESSAAKTVKKKKIRREFFSRGRMPEEEELTETPIKETKKSESTSNKEL
jgi:hypothetical protein